MNAKSPILRDSVFRSYFRSDFLELHEMTETSNLVLQSTIDPQLSQEKVVLFISLLFLSRRTDDLKIQGEIVFERPTINPLVKWRDPGQRSSPALVEVRRLRVQRTLFIWFVLFILMSSLNTYRYTYFPVCLVVVHVAVVGGKIIMSIGNPVRNEVYEVYIK